ncbi:ATPase AAA [Gracilibacillus halophilus YIM-C55.5]|uniref:ATPase AAA n=1 Tax=Gracilibacillus halophilus YIM-C55.5 TaxID=1308866 RepID=N4WDR8_9BACI|nr:ATPase AAA [Gracilibacillus halophilus YIM-C55.5]
MKAVQVYALLQGRTYVIPDDMKQMAKPVLAHRIVPSQRIGVKQGDTASIIDEILQQVTVPTEREKDLV